MAYIIPRKRTEEETNLESLIRRTEENIEFYYACGRMSHVSFLEEILKELLKRDIL